MRASATSRAFANEPHSTSLSHGTTSARMKPRSMSLWILPAALSAGVPRGMGQARASGGPDPVKNVMRSSRR